MPTLNNIIIPAKSIIIKIVLANFNLMIFPANSYYHDISCQLLSSWYFLPTLIIILAYLPEELHAHDGEDEYDDAENES